MNSYKNAEFDTYLSKLGLARKPLINDHSSLFRVVSEKLYLTQSYHEKVFEKYVDYLREHSKQYKPLLDETVEERITGLTNKTTFPGEMEMKVLSKMFRIDFIIFRASKMDYFNLTQNYYGSWVFLCSTGFHYDLICSKSSLDASTIVQSILYEMLYRKVFKLETEQLDESVVFIDLQKRLPRDKRISECFPQDIHCVFGSDHTEILTRLEGKTGPPLPYRVAKALHPSVYRNVELDLVQEEKREERLKALTARKGFSVGDKCQVIIGEEEPLHGYIQNIDTDLNIFDVFVEEKGVIKSFDSDNVHPLSLGTNTDSQDEVGVAFIDILPFKRNRKKKGLSVLKFGDIESTPRRPRPLPIQTSPQYSTSSSSSGGSSHGNSTSCCRRTRLYSLLEANCDPPTPVATQPYCSFAHIRYPVEYNPTLTLPIENSPVFTDASTPVGIMSSGVPAVPANPAYQNPMYWMPVMALPYPAATSLGQVHVGWMPSPDAALPDSMSTPDLTSPHILSTHGVEYYRMPNNPQGSYHCAMYQPAEVSPALMDYNGNVTSQQTVSVEQTKQQESASNVEQESRTGEESVNKTFVCNKLASSRPTPVNATSRSPEPNKSLGKGVNCDLEESVNESMEVGSDGDSGCPSDCTELSTANSSDSTHGDNSVLDRSSDAQKPKGKRRYYMYGNHKLIKPIKEIPLRFRILLAETSAAKARCEGQPIYMQPTTQYDLVYFSPNLDDSQQQLNANAACFIPHQTIESNTGFLPDGHSVVTPNSLNSSLPFLSQPVTTAAGGAPSSAHTYIAFPSSQQQTLPVSSSVPVTSHPKLLQSVSIPPPPLQLTSVPPPPVDHSAPLHVSQLNQENKIPVPINIPPPNHAHAHNLSLKSESVSICNNTLPHVLAAPTNQLSSSANQAPVIPQSVGSTPGVQGSSSGAMVTSFHSPASYPTAGSGSQYMYVYPSPTGQNSTPTQGPVMYMVGPTYQQPPGVYMPNYAVSVQ